MPKTLYIFSGLGADKRAFAALDLSAFNPIFIDWIPAGKNETLEQYVSRLITQISDSESFREKPTLIGLSFGGMVAVEVAKQIDCEQVILIASAKSKAEIPPYFRLLGKLRLHKLIPTKLLKTPTFITYWFFGVKSADDKALLKQILHDTDDNFLNWAIDKILHWQNTTIPTNLTHIHGTADKILPIRFVDNDITISGGGHLMTLSKATELNKILASILE